MGKVDVAMQRGDVRGMIRAVIQADVAASLGDVCRCEEPDLTGRRSCYCFKCDRLNLDRKAEIEGEMQAPHPFEPMGEGLRSGFCDFCTFPKTDVRHTF